MLIAAVRIGAERGATPGSIRALLLARKTAQARIVRSIVAGGARRDLVLREFGDSVDWVGDVHPMQMLKRIIEG